MLGLLVPGVGMGGSPAAEVAPAHNIALSWTQPAAESLSWAQPAAESLSWTQPAAEGLSYTRE